MIFERNLTPIICLVAGITGQTVERMVINFYQSPELV